MTDELINDRQFMRRALDLAVKGAGFVSPNPMVGAVVVKDGQVIGQGYHQSVGGPHAEVHALDAAGSSARGATLYVTLEPCNHFGRTPPCTQKIMEAGIRRVVVAMADPDPTVKGGGNGYLASQGIEVECGVCEQSARQLNESFIKFKTTGRPFVILKMAATLDGRIATRTGDARWVTGEAARSRVHEMRHAMDAIMVGIGTVEADDPRLTARLANGRGIDPVRIILDTNLKLRPKARILTSASTAATYVACAPHADQQKKKRLIEKGAKILEIPLRDAYIDLTQLMQRLGTMGITSVLVEGGGQVATGALNSDIVDKVALFYAPKLLVSDQGVPMCRGQGPEKMTEALALKNIEVSRIGEDILVEGYLH
jgi:diaminohydroxyphosphoribosylaminopyrimidine deaminase/5-amino-6-(5-phosphoribosylamino)uracil reductase